MVGVLIVVVIIVIVGLIGWKVLGAKKAPTKTVTTTTSGSSNAPSTTSQSTTSTNSDGTKYLEIKEWGVKFKLTTATLDAYYDNKKTTTLDAMSLRSHSLDTESDCTASPQSVATIFRVPKDAMDDQAGKKYSEADEGKTIGDYFYFIQGSQYNCTDNLDKQIILQGARNSFNTASPSIQKI